MYIWYNLLTFYLAFYSDILSDIYSDFLSGILCGIYTDIFSGILSGIFSAICSGMLSSILSDILFWHSIWYFFGHSLWLRSGGKHSDPELAVEVRRGTLWSGACGGGPEWNTLIQKLLLGSGGEHCDLALAVEGPARSGGRKEEGGGLANIKSNNPHLTGGEKTPLVLRWTGALRASMRVWNLWQTDCGRVQLELPRIKDGNRMQYLDSW